MACIRPLPKALWLPDHSVDICEGCDQKFSLFDRRHHCRFCGHIFCHPCTNKLVQAHRCCEACFCNMGLAKLELNCDPIPSDSNSDHEAVDNDETLRMPAQSRPISISMPQPANTTAIQRALAERALSTVERCSVCDGSWNLDAGGSYNSPASCTCREKNNATKSVPTGGRLPLARSESNPSSGSLVVMPERMTPVRAHCNSHGGHYLDVSVVPTDIYQTGKLTSFWM